MSTETTIWLAVGLAVWSGVVAMFALLRPVEGRHALTARLCTAAIASSSGAALLRRHALQSPQWWQTAEVSDRADIDRTLCTWDLLAWYARTDRADKRAVLDVLSFQIVDLWEWADPYVQHRRQDQPRLWASLAELYLDAYDRGARAESLPDPGAGAPATAAAPASSDASPSVAAAEPPGRDDVPVPVFDSALAATPAEAVVPAPVDEWEAALMEALRRPFDKPATVRLRIDRFAAPLPGSSEPVPRPTPGLSPIVARTHSRPVTIDLLDVVEVANSPQA